MKKVWKIQYAYAAFVLVFGVLVVAAVGNFSHTKTKVVTRTVTKQKAAVFNGTLTDLVAFLRPKTGSQVKCPKTMPVGANCFQLGSTKWYIFFAAPASALAS